MSKVVKPSVYTDSHAGAIPGPPLRHAHDAAAARDDSGELKRDYEGLSRDILCHVHSHLNLALNEHLGFECSNPPGAANTIVRKSFVKSLNERDAAFAVGPG